MLWVSTRDGNPELYACNADGTGLKRLTSEVAFDLHPAWSPDGKRIAFTSGRAGRQKIYVMNADGSDVKKLTDGDGLGLVAGVVAGRQADRLRVQPRRQLRHLR